MTDLSEMLVKLYYIVIFLYMLLQTAIANYDLVYGVQAEYCKNQKKNADTSWRVMQVLPGIGWDNLRNIDMGLVFDFDYAQCQLTADGKFLLPDGFFATPLQESTVETLSEFIDHWNDYTSLTSSSINAAASGFIDIIQGKFSAEYSTAKTKMYNENQISKVSRIHIKHKLYIVRLQPGTKLNPKFKARLMDIARPMMSNHSELARYLSELLIRDYGTHYSTAAYAGGIIALEDFIHNTEESQDSERKRNLSISASINFLSKVGFNAGFQYSHDRADKQSSAYSDDRTSSHIRTIGGPPYRVNFSVNDWENGLLDALAAIDREGVPLHFAITPELLSELPPAQTLELANYVQNATKLYYKYNSHYGCTDHTAKNFMFGANIDDGSCDLKPSAANFRFGGVYQTCSHSPTNNTDIICPDLKQENPLTGKYSCEPGYQAVLLHSGTKSGSYSTKHCKEQCKRLLHIFNKHDCHQVCDNINYNVHGNYQTYWCVDHNRQPPANNSGYMFGGLYSSTAVNPLTRTRSCPPYFYPLRFGENTHICVSDDYDLGSPSSIKFAGFDSCSVGNPWQLTNSSIDHQSKWPHRCPSGYNQLLASTEQSCEINYCVEAGIFNEQGFPPIKLPPYRKYPSFSPYAYKALSIVSSKGDLWKQDDETKEWRIETSFNTKERLTRSVFDTDPSQLFIDTDVNQNSHDVPNSHEDNKSSVTLVLALIISITALILGLFIAGAVYVMHKHNEHKTSYRWSHDNTVNTDAANSNELELPADV